MRYLVYLLFIFFIFCSVVEGFVALFLFVSCKFNMCVMFNVILDKGDTCFGTQFVLFSLICEFKSPQVNGVHTTTTSKII